MNKIITSKQFTINLGDTLRGLLVAVITSVLTVVYDSLNLGSLEFDWKKIAITGLTAGISYLLKNFFTQSKIVIPATKEEIEKIEDKI